MVTLCRLQLGLPCDLIDLPKKEWLAAKKPPEYSQEFLGLSTNDVAALAMELHDTDNLDEVDSVMNAVVADLCAFLAPAQPLTKPPAPAPAPAPTPAVAMTTTSLPVPTPSPDQATTPPSTPTLDEQHLKNVITTHLGDLGLVQPPCQCTVLFDGPNLHQVHRHALHAGNLSTTAVGSLAVLSPSHPWMLTSPRAVMLWFTDKMRMILMIHPLLMLLNVSWILSTPTQLIQPLLLSSFLSVLHSQPPSSGMDKLLFWHSGTIFHGTGLPVQPYDVFLRRRI